MITEKANAHWVVWLTLSLAFLLSIVPLPAWLSVARPVWVVLFAIYWMMALPGQFGLFFAFSTGLMLDILLGTAFGQNAMAMLLVSVIVISLHRRLRMYPWWQQAFMIFVITGFYQLINLWVKSALGRSQVTLWYLAPAFTSAAVWPWIGVFLRHVRRTYEVT